MSGLKQKSEHHPEILHIQIKVGTRFKFKLKILIFFFDKIHTKSLFLIKNEKSEYHQ